MSTNNDLTELLQQGLEALHLSQPYLSPLSASTLAAPSHISFSPDTISSIIPKLLAYIDLLIKWNKTYNLTAISDPREIISHHILDSLAILPYIKGSNVLDVGSGAGLPGIPLALFLPQYNFVLLDSNGKKTRFMSHAVMNLSIPNIKVVQARIEKFNFTPCFDTIVTRAFSSLKDIVVKSQHLCCVDGQLLAMKGKYPQEELAELSEFNLHRAAPSSAQSPSLLVSVQRLQVPQLDAERHLICIIPVVN